MPKSKATSKRTARAASSGAGGLPRHPALAVASPLLGYRLGHEEPLRMPDHHNDPTAATVLRNEYTLSSDAAGHLVFAEHNTLLLARCVYTVTAGVLGASATSTVHPQSAAFTAEARAARMVAIKVQVTYIGAAQTTSGYLSYVTKTSLLDTHSATVDAVHTGALAQSRSDVPLTVYGDYTQDPRWEDPAANSFMANTHKVHVFIASGLPANTPCYRVRVLRFMEYLPVEGALAEGELQHEPHDGASLSVHGALSGPMTSIARGADMGAFARGVLKVANAAYHIAQPLVPYVVPRARAFLQGAFQAALPMLMA